MSCASVVSRAWICARSRLRACQAISAATTASEIAAALKAARNSLVRTLVRIYCSSSL